MSVLNIRHQLGFEVATLTLEDLTVLSLLS